VQYLRLPVAPKPPRDDCERNREYLTPRSFGHWSKVRQRTRSGNQHRTLEVEGSIPFGSTYFPKGWHSSSSATHVQTGLLCAFSAHSGNTTTVPASRSLS